MTEEEKKVRIEEAIAKLREDLKKRPSKSGPVQDRLKGFATRDVASTDTIGMPKQQKPINLKEAAKKENKTIKEATAAGIQLGKPTPTSDKDKDKTKEKEKEKEKDKDKEKDPVKQQEAKMKEAFSKIKLPSGMEIHQEGPQWVLVSKDGKQRSDITDVMNSIDKYNRKVDEANGVDSAQAAAQAQVDKKADPMKADAQTTERAGKIAPLLVEVKDTSGKPVFDPQDLQKVAETGIQHSQELALLERLEKDPKFVEKLKDREKKNQDKADDRAMRAPVNEGR